MTILLFGFLFGAILQYASLNKYNTIGGLATLENYTVAKALFFAIGLGAILLSFEVGLGLASFHVKPLIAGGIVAGGLIFGAGMAILGYCPGTLAISLGEGSLDALVGILGGLAGGLVYTLILPAIQPFLGPNLGVISISSLMGAGVPYYLVTILMGAAFIGIAFWLHKVEKLKNLKWLYSGIALAVLCIVVFSNLAFDRPVGASSAYPYIADSLTGVVQNEYFEKIKASGSWEVIFLAGALLAGLIISHVKKTFKFTFTHSQWVKYKGDSVTKRIVWSFIGGFIMIIGARMAGGCTSGHILSGGMQLAISSLTFAVFVFAGLLLTGKLFYKY